MQKLRTLTEYNLTDIHITTHWWTVVYKHTAGVCVVFEEVWAVLWTRGSLPVRGGGDQIWALITAVVSCSLPQSQHCDIHQGFSLFFFLSCFVFYQTGSDWSSPQSRWLLGDLRRFTVPPIPVSELQLSHNDGSEWGLLWDETTLCLPKLAILLSVTLCTFPAIESSNAPCTIAKTHRTYQQRRDATIWNACVIIKTWRVNLERSTITFKWHLNYTQLRSCSHRTRSCTH